MEIVDVVDQLPRHPKKKYSRRPLTQISMVVVHHSATTSGGPEAFARYHVEAHGWPGIGYHYVIAKDGTVYKTNNASTVSYHAKGANLKSIGVCLVGNLDREHPTDVQMDALVELLQELIKAYGISPDNVIGHREVPGTRKSCPGNKFDMDALRARLRRETGSVGRRDGKDEARQGEARQGEVNREEARRVEAREDKANYDEEARQAGASREGLGTEAKTKAPRA